MSRIALGIEYDGTAFNGWQIQKRQSASPKRSHTDNPPGHPIRSVQHCVEQALSSVANHVVDTSCAGRTDSGVHACGQVVHFDTDADRSTHGWVMGANSNLPNDINVLWATLVGGDFHARYSAVSRSYRYLILNRQQRSSLYRDRATWINRPLNESAMHAAGQALIGEHDFSAFRASECQSRTPMRHVSRLHVQRQGDCIIIDIEANAFLHHMVRNIAGVLLRIGQGDAAVEWAAEVLVSRDRREGGVTAPAQGLYLFKVDYPEDMRIPAETTPPPLPINS